MAIPIGAMFGLAAGQKGMDLTNQLLTTAFSNYLGGKNEKKSLRRQYEYAQKYALNSPSWNVQGLRKAGLNPILAATDGAFSSPTVPSVGRNNPSGSDGSSVDLIGSVMQSKAIQSTIDTNKSQSFKNFAEGLTKLKNGGLSGGYGAIKTLASSLGINDSDAQKVLKDFGFTPPNPLGISVPDGARLSPHDVKSRNAPDDGKSSVEIPSHGSYDSKPYSGSRTGSWRADMNRIRKENLKYEKMLKRRRYERWIDYDKSFDRMPNVRRSIYR